MLSDHKIAAVFGGSGFLGRYVVQRLAALGYTARIGVRDPESAKILQPMGDVGQIVPLYAPVTDEAAVARAVEGAELVINLAGILAERRKDDFLRTHVDGAGRIAHLAHLAGSKQLIHISAIGTDAQSASLYAQTKAKGEAAVRAAFPHVVILRPSIMFGPEDNFFNRFAAMATVFPVLPIVHGAAKFQPVYVGDVADAVIATINGHAGQIFELGGPEVKSFAALLAVMLEIIGRPRKIWDMPVGLARFQANILEHLPGKLLTNDQIDMLGRDNVVASGAPGLESLGILPTWMDQILPLYLMRYREGGRGREAVFQE
jgi:uncharacterized protein YbjT (DUF2867 family)